MKNSYKKILSTKPQLVANSFRFTEGPAADHDGNIYFVDIGNHRIHFYDVARQTVSLVRENSGGADGMIVGADGTLWICELHDQKLSKIDSNGNYQVVLDSFEGKPLSGPNDLWFDDVGGLYFTDSYGGHEDRGNETRVFYYSPTGELSLLEDDYYKSNGLHGSPDGRWLYIADYLDDKIYRYPMLKPGLLGDREMFVEYRCDGMTMDENGYLYLATGNSSQGVVIVSPDGATLGSIPMPEDAHNICFGGPAMDTLYITATSGLYSVETDLRAAPNGSPHRYVRDFGGLADLIEPGAKSKLLTTGFHNSQGPAALPNGDFYFSDIYNHKTLKWEFATSELKTVREETRGGDGLAVMQDGSVLVCELTGKRLGRITPGGNYEIVADSFEGEPLTGANDVFLDRHGGIYFSDSYPGMVDDPQPITRVFYIAPGSNELKLLVDDLYKGKGIHISPDEKWIYIVDFEGRVVYRYELMAPGELGQREPLINRMCGGLALDERGNIYISTVADGTGVLVYSPEGELLGQILVPDWTSNVTFAGPEHKSLVITAGSSVYTVDMQVRGLQF